MIIKDLVKVDDYCAKFGLATQHPLVSVLDLATGVWVQGERTEAVRYHFYGVFLKQGESCSLRYGRQNYDYQDGTLVFIGPGQIVEVSHLDKSFKPSGYALLFHPDLLHRTSLGRTISRYSFFSYGLNEALHLSQQEKALVLDCFKNISFELSQGMDKHSKELIVSNIELFLKYCKRFYDRQFITRDQAIPGSIDKFNTLLLAYIQTGQAKEEGIPSVAYFASQLHLSPNYFGDLVKKETGKSAQEYIQLKIIELAKEKIFDPQKSISEIAFELGFKHPQHFTRLFKKKVGYSPIAFRNLN